MRNLITILALTLESIGLRAQAITEDDSLYLVALQKFTIQIDSFYTKYSEQKGRYEPLYLEDTELMDSIPTEIQGRKITVINSNNWKTLYKQNGNQLIHVKIFPIEIKNGYIEVSIIPYHGKLEKRKHINLALNSWTNVFFRYGCETKKWEYDRTENGGI